MKKSTELRQALQAKEAKIAEMLAKLATESRTAFDENEKTAYQALKTDIEGLEEVIQATEAAEARAAKQAANAAQFAGGNVSDQGEKRSKQKIVAEYRFVDAVRTMVNGGKREGLLAEMDQEARAEASRFGQTVEGLGVPAFFTEKRDSTVGTAASAGTTVDTTLGGLIGLLRPTLAVEGMGAQVLTGLTSNLDLPRQTAGIASAWEGETDENAEGEPTFDRVTLRPKRLGVFTEVSKQLLVQSSLAMEQLLRNDMNIAQSLALDLAAVNGSGASNQPRGILNTVGIGNVPIGTNGGAPTRAHHIALMKEVAVDNALAGSLGFLSNHAIKAKLMSTLLDAGSGQFLLEGETMLGYNYRFSNQVPANLTKGTSNGTLSAIIFGNFNDLILGQWGGLDLVVDPYTKATQAMVRLVVNSWWDVAVRHPESFAAILDADPAL
jgi:HK97 family phage major capsid protein